jgi:hypothetical protein
MTIRELFEQHIRPLPHADQVRLLALIESALARGDEDGERTESLLALEGVGAEIWLERDAQAYVDDLRREWDGLS